MIEIGNKFVLVLLLLAWFGFLGAFIGFLLIIAYYHIGAFSL